MAKEAALPERLRHVYWIGGGSGAGKSTIARRLAARHGLRLYASDETMADHAARLKPGGSPFLSTFAAMDMDERWVNRSPEAMLDTFHWFRGEGFDLIVEDLMRLQQGPAVIAEGFRLLPRLVKPCLVGPCLVGPRLVKPCLVKPRLVEPCLAVPGHAVWLLPTPEFRRAAFESRGSLWEIAGRTGNPDRALRNLLERDRMFTDRLRREAKGLGLRVVEVDTATTEDGLTGQVAEALGL